MKKPKTKEIRISSGREGKKLEAFSLKFQGFTYPEISKETGYSIYTLEQNFYKKGKWHKSYRKWAKQRVDDITSGVNDALVAQAIAAFQRMVNLSVGKFTVAIERPDGKKILAPIIVKDKTIFSANKDILDRAGFKPAEKIEVETPEDKAEDITKEFEEAEAKIANKKKTNE